MSRKNPFMPFIEDFDAEAEAFLRHYDCVEAITKPMPVPIWDIARRMTLDVIDTECLSYDDSVQGAIAFDNGVIDVYDWNERQVAGFEVHAGTVFIDAGIINEGRRNNTLAHECFHWHKHRHYFLYERKHNNTPDFAFRCEKGNSKASSKQARTDEEWMEWQAKMMAPRILMPKKAAEKLLKQLIKRSVGFVNRKEATELMIDEFSTVFAVSKQSAAIRMADLGYSPALDFCSYEDSAQERQISYKRKSQTKQHMQPISQIEAFELYCENEMLRATLQTGAFCFADGYFVLNDEKYITGEVEDHLTEYAREHLPECTLDFSKKLVSTSLMHAAPGLMYRGDQEFSSESSFDANTQNTELYNKAKDFEKRFQRSKKNHQTPAEWMCERMNEEHWNRVVFEERTGLDAMNYTRVQKKPDHPFTMKPLVAMGVGLRLTLDEMSEVLELAGLTFSHTNKEQKAYEYLFTGMQGKDISECNEFLTMIGVSPLGSQQRL